MNYLIIISIVVVITYLFVLIKKIKILASMNYHLVIAFNLYEQKLLDAKIIKREDLETIRVQFQNIASEEYYNKTIDSFAYLDNNYLDISSTIFELVDNKKDRKNILRILKTNIYNRNIGEYLKDYNAHKYVKNLLKQNRIKSTD